jgi:hypothetical protein
MKVKISYKNLIIIVIAATFMLPGMIAVDKGFCAEVANADSVFTCDLSDNPRIYFNPGDDIRYKVNFTTEGPVTAVLLRGAVKGSNFRQTLPWQYGILPAGTYTTIWDKKLPSDASGKATVSITYIGLVDEVTTKETTFTVTDSSVEPSDVGSNTCKMCHSQIHDSLKDSSHGFMECETCHGPGSIHTSSPSKDTINVDKSSSLCGRCHTRGDDQNRIEAEDSLIKRNQQYDELLSGGKGSFNCVRCHDPHISISLNPQDAITTSCSNCHSKTVNQVHISAGLECIDCHMPYAVKKETSAGEGDHLKGDGRSHIFTVNAYVEPYEMFYQEGGETFANGFLTLNFTCLGCHDGYFAREHEFEWAYHASGLIH